MTKSERMKGNKIWLGRKHTEEAKKKISLSKRGVTPWIKGKTFKEIGRIPLSGFNHPMWKGGISNKNQRIRHTAEYRLWRESVFTRDNYTCVWCGKRGCYLEPDHIKPFCDYPELRFAIDNGRTLCRECHSKTSTYKGRSNKGKKYKQRDTTRQPEDNS